jgi:hypothetical protein
MTISLAPIVLLTLLMKKKKIILLIYSFCFSFLPFLLEGSTFCHLVDSDGKEKILFLILLWPLSIK